MKTWLPLFCLSVALAHAFTNTASAQDFFAPGTNDMVPDGLSPGIGNTNGVNHAGGFASEIRMPFPGRAWMSYTGVPEGLGYGTGGYFTLGGKTRLGEDIWNGRWLFESRGHLAHEQGQVFMNIGVERVFTIDPANADVGFSIWYDADLDRERNFGHSFYQIGLGGYVRHPRWEVAFNGYIPVGETGFQLGSPENCFVGNHILIQTGIDTAMEGFDTEFRFKPEFLAMWQGSFDLGFYYYTDNDGILHANGMSNDLYGVRLRTSAQLFNGCRGEFEYNYDERFDDTMYFRVVMSTQVFGDYDPLGRDLDPTVRNDHVVKVHQDPLFAVDPDTGARYIALHVDNTAGPGGDGTAERPFDALADVDPLQGGASSPDDVIFVREGDGTFTNYDTGITLQDGQLFLGDGFRHRIPLARGGFFELCDDQDGNKPMITGPDGSNIVTLADRNTVAGFKIDGGDPAANGIVGDGIVGGVTIRDNMFMNLSNDGVNINTIEGDIIVTGNMFTNIADDAIDISDVNSRGNTIAFVDNSIGDATDGIGDNGIVINGFVSENTWIFNRNEITNTGVADPVGDTGDGIALIDGFDAIGGVGGTYTFIDNVITDAGRFGINLSNIDDAEAAYAFSGNTITNSALAAIRFENVNGISPVFSGTNSLLGGTAGFQFDANNGATFGVAFTGITLSGGTTGMTFNATGGSTINVSIEDSIFEDNTDDGLLFFAENGTININTFQRNILRNNGGQGVELRGGDNGIFTATIQDNLFENNAEGGLFANITDDSLTANANLNLDLIVGADPASDKGNIFDGNGGFGIGVVLAGDATGRFEIQDNLIIRTVDDPNSTTFNGEGIHVRLAGTDFLANSTAEISTAAAGEPSFIANNTIGSLTDPTLGNASHGIQVFTEDETVFDDLDIRTNIIANNGVDGINITADDSSEIRDLRIFQNLIDSNTNDGVQISALRAAVFDSTAPFGIIENRITNNGFNGINLAVVGDGQLDVDITENLIDENAGDGINTSQSVNSITDSRRVGGTWSLNTITNNALDGIDLTTAYGGLAINMNTITDNGLFGIDIPGPGTATFDQNLIARNGAAAVVGTGTGGGVNIRGVGVKNLTFTDNVIRENIGHGMRIVNNSGSDFPFRIVATGNTIEANTERGVNIFNQGSAVTNVRLEDNKIASNGEEGVFVVNTASTQQDPDADADNALAFLNADGAVTADGRLTFVANNNLIINNGSDSALSSTGLILLVGTNDGGYGFTQDGGFFGEGFGGVGATITNNTFAGNAGEDVFIASFVSTDDPNTTGGAWTDQNEDPRDDGNDTFNPQGFQGDPLARLDLLWNGNVFDTIAVTNTGAFYNNNEPVFKSRTQGQDNGTDGPHPTGGDDNGPFNSGARQRNAQRLAARDVDSGGTQLPPNYNFGGSEDFLYPGMGQSTFRLLPGFDGTAGFIQDDFYIDMFDANGVGADNPPNAMPFGWNFLGGNPRPQ